MPHLHQVLLNLELTQEEKEFIAFVAAYFDSSKYLELNKDVADAGVDPLEHWLNHGIGEGRLFSPYVELRCGRAAGSFYCRRWPRYRWRKESVAVRIRQLLPPEIMAQIINQAQHDPAILAPGLRAIANLRQFAGSDLLTRDGLDFDRLFASIPHRPDVLIIVPFLGLNGAQKFAASLVPTLRVLGYRSFQVLVTDQGSADNPSWGKFAILAPFRSVSILYWRDVYHSSSPSERYIRRDPSNETPLALLVNGLRPRVAIVVSSRMGLDMVTRFGRALSQYVRLYCAYFAVGGEELEASHGIRFARRTSRFATSLTDNDLAANALRDRYGNLPGHNVAALPPQVASVDEATFNKRLSARRHRIYSTTRPARWVWIGRIGSTKGTQLLGRLARLRPFDRFLMFGPVDGTLNSFGLAQPNITYRGLIEDITTMDFSDCDGFVLTNSAMGTSNIALEMSQHAIPLVLPRIGATLETFDEEAVFFVDPADDDNAATAFSLGLDRVAGLTADRGLVIMVAACSQAQRRHSPAVFARNVEGVFGAPS